MQKTTVRLLITGMLFIAGLEYFVPVNSYAELERNRNAYYTIQMGTYISENAAEKNYLQLAEKLNDSQLHYLRIEKMKKYYVVRIGRYENKDDADRFYLVVRDKVTEPPVVTKTKVGPEVLIKEYKATRKSSTKVKQPLKVVKMQSLVKERALIDKGKGPPPTAVTKKQVAPLPVVKMKKEVAALPNTKSKNRRLVQ